MKFERKLQLSELAELRAENIPLRDGAKYSCDCDPSDVRQLYIENADLRAEVARLKAERVEPRPFSEAWQDIKRVLAWDVERKEWRFVTPVRFHPYCVGDDGLVSESQFTYFIELPPPPSEDKN